MINVIVFIDAIIYYVRQNQCDHCLAKLRCLVHLHTDVREPT